MARILKDDHTGRMTNFVTRQGPGEGADYDLFDFIDLSRLDREQFPWWIAELGRSEQGLRRIRQRLSAALTGVERHCPVCGTAVTGRADQVYCGATCRQRARRS